jgi:hypothetical protein
MCPWSGEQDGEGGDAVNQDEVRGDDRGHKHGDPTASIAELDRPPTEVSLAMLRRLGELEVGQPESGTQQVVITPPDGATSFRRPGGDGAAPSRLAAADAALTDA